MSVSGPPPQAVAFQLVRGAMVSLPGKERTEAEWRALYAAAGLAVASIRPINPATGESIVEGVKR